MSASSHATADPRSVLLRRGMDAMSLPASEAVLGQLLDYLDLLAKWNRTYNLSAVRDPMEMVQQHLLDCLAVIPALDRHLEGLKPRLLDVGSGAGLPAVVLALMRPNWFICSVDSVAKKVSFVRQVASELPLRNLFAEHARVEALKQPPFDVVISRAFASLIDFTTLTRGLLAPGACWVAMKGRVPDEELAALPGDVEVFHVEQLRIPGLDAQRCLVWMRPI